MRDTLFVFWLLAAVATIALAVTLWRLRRHTAPVTTQAKEDERRIQQEIRQGARLPDGRPRCRHCDAPATRPALKTGRDEGLVGWLRAQIGAPSRYRIIEDTWGEAAYCEPHAQLATAEFRTHLITVEAKRLDEIRDREVELARFEKVGLDEQINYKVKVHERETRKNDPAASSSPPQSAKVVNLR
jgi:hypothetical protein